MGSHGLLDERGPGGEVILTWEFLEAPNRRFYWRAFAADGSITHQSRETFRSLDECAADASRMWLDLSVPARHRVKSALPGNPRASGWQPGFCSARTLGCYPAPDFHGPPHVEGSSS